LFESIGPFPASAAGKAIVTTHGDFHLANILVGGSIRWDSSDPSATLHLGTTGAKVCDFENSGVGRAVGDLTYALKMWCQQDYSHRCAVCRGYLKALERPAEEEDVFVLLLDVERCSLRFVHPLATVIPESGIPPLKLSTLHGWWYGVRRILFCMFCARQPPT
jgi:Ser/Thr protein kinase RdoA (MazF antagonist)